MNKKRKQDIVNFCIQIAKDELNEELTYDQKINRMEAELDKIRPSPIEFAIINDLIDNFIDKIKKGEINER